MVYAEAPWTFKGRALYQLQLVKADEARKHIPAELKLVEFCGFTLGGVYLARYDDSPAGEFDECVAMAGLVWNPPTSCAWAARVYVNNKEARDHGIKSVGLPSRLASFDTVSNCTSSKQAWWSKGKTKSHTNPKPSTSSSSSSGSSSSSSSRKSEQDVIALMNVDKGRRGLADRPVAVFRLPEVPTSGFLGPRMRLSLPSFSGGTVDCPDLLQYSCDLQTSVMPVTPMQIQLPQQQQQQQSSSSSIGRGSKQQQQQQPEVLDMLLDGKPLMCLAFSDMVMKVEEPKPLQLAAADQQQLLPALATMLPRK